MRVCHITRGHLSRAGSSSILTWSFRSPDFSHLRSAKVWRPFCLWSPRSTLLILIWKIVRKLPCMMWIWKKSWGGRNIKESKKLMMKMMKRRQEVCLEWHVTSSKSLQSTLITVLVMNYQILHNEVVFISYLCSSYTLYRRACLFHQPLCRLPLLYKYLLVSCFICFEFSPLFLFESY